MDLTYAHERSDQVVGHGYIETRQFWFDPNGQFLTALISVVLSDGSKTDLVGTNEDGVVMVDGNLRYPDDTFLTAGFSVDGRATIMHAHTHTRDTTHWHYLPDGSAEVSQVEWRTGEVATTQWQLSPDGAPVGDVREHVLIGDGSDGYKTIETIRQRDGTVTSTTKVVNAHGELITSETTVVHFDPNPQPPPANGRLPSRPAPGGGGGDRFGDIEPTTRAPDPNVSGGGGWIGGTGPMSGTRHITDWWFRGSTGDIRYLGSTANAKTKTARGDPD
ncbi:hypothetical protein SAMN05192575_106193 [Nocardioides alpinus]|uniref:Uncharacterized protein n=1 Tax=Nocardioides alpinus TaxID=748909 RepID=A0A1I0ZSK0_9ACTN|nr:hypothetical protein [Nocardioides alpinus]PKH41834.1 hypothetical protein CXG46_08190 [Nocardioides alpinus]SFB28517.1 hypothetical protein SAMN05192575_106193 [Nocardioides alpinus]